jgi:hypothetical protein
VWLPAGFEVTYAGPDGREVRAGLDRLRRADLEACQPVRSFPSYQGQRNYPGWYWSARMGRRVGFESWVERGHLVALDFDPAVTAIVSQPFWLHWRTTAGKARRHSPDFISNRGKQLGRKGLIVSGPSGTGKSTSITQLGKIHQVDTQRRAPRGDGRIPVVYIHRRAALPVLALPRRPGPPLGPHPPRPGSRSSEDGPGAGHLLRQSASDDRTLTVLIPKVTL